MREVVATLIVALTEFRNVCPGVWVLVTRVGLSRGPSGQNRRVSLCDDDSSEVRTHMESGRSRLCWMGRDAFFRCRSGSNLLHGVLQLLLPEQDRLEAVCMYSFVSNTLVPHQLLPATLARKQIGLADLIRSSPYRMYAGSNPWASLYRPLTAKKSCNRSAAPFRVYRHGKAYPPLIRV